MKLEDVKKFIEENIEDEAVAEYVNGFRKVDEVNVDLIKQKMEEDGDIKSFIESIKDKHAHSSLETWKSNNLEDLISNKVKERFPEVDERDIAIQELENKLNSMEKARENERLRNLALKQATDRKLPTDLVDYFIGEDEETTLANLDNLEAVFTSSLESGVKSRLKDNSYVPPKSNSNKTLTADDFADMTEDQINEYYDKQLHK